MNQRATTLKKSPALAACVAISALLVAGCGSTDTKSAKTTSAAPGQAAAPSGSNEASSAPLAHAKAQVARFTAPVTEFAPPGPEITGLKEKLQGKTVWYIPVFLKAPYFTAAAQGIAEPLALFGAQLHVCDAGANPSQADTCIKQAIAAKPAAIITDSMNFSFASRAYTSAIDAKIPILAQNNDEPGGFPSNPLVQALNIGGPQYTRLAADWMIADSEGKANVLYAADNADNGNIETAAGLDEFKTNCPDCKVTVVNFTDANLQALATAVSSTLVKNPAIDYVFGAYDAPAGIYALQGAKQVTGRKFKYITVGNQPPALQRIAAGDQVMVCGFDPAGSSWNAADALFRMLTGAAPVDHTPVLRLFTKENLPANTGDATGYASGAWMTNGAFRDMYKKLWTVTS